MDFECACIAEHLGQNLKRGAANDRVFDNAYALVLENAYDGVELELDFLLADVLRGVDKCTAYIVIAQKADFKSDATSLCVAERCCCGAVGHGNHDVCIDGTFLGELLTHLAADFVAALFENLGIRAAEIDVFENAVCESVFLRESFRVEPVL